MQTSVRLKLSAPAHHTFSHSTQFSLNVQCSIYRGLEFNHPPLWCLSTPWVCIETKKIVKTNQKYIADPLWFSHKSSIVNLKNEINKNKK